VALSLAELVVVSLVIRARHRVARSALGRLYGFSYDVFSSIHGVIAMALQRTFSGRCGCVGRGGGGGRGRAVWGTEVRELCAGAER
jgi:hypothetical protein